MKVVKLRGELGERFISSYAELAGSNLIIAVIEQGEVTCQTPNDFEKLTGSGWLLLPVSKDFKLRAKSGTVGFILIVSGVTLASAMRNLVDSLSFGRWIKTASRHELSGHPALINQLNFYLSSLHNEKSHQQVGSDTLCESWLLCLLLLVWREFRISTMAIETHAFAFDQLNNFRTLVEMNFRRRWSVSDYANQLAITPDHLHDLCQRQLNKPPSQLIQERTLYAAVLLLTQSNDSIQQISDALGFRSPAYFCSYFKRAMNTTPRQFRVSKAKVSEEDQELISFSDWP